MTIAVEWVLLDIEGTLLPTRQVHVVLYDYARSRLRPWIEEHRASPAVAEAVEQVHRLGGLAPGADTDAVVGVLHAWMDADQKVAPLKILQGLIWQRGFAAGDLVTEFFTDVVPALRAWRGAGLRLAVFSSGSVAAQIACLTRSTEGDVTGLIHRHFDQVNAGPKRQPAAYRTISAALGADPARAVYLSDLPAELEAAAAAGWQTIGVARPGERYADSDFGPRRIISSFDQLGLVSA